MNNLSKRHLWMVLMVAVMGISVSVGWGGEVVDESQIIYHDGLAYKKGVDHPFTGTMRVYYLSGSLKATVEFRNGKMNGKLIIWFENGQKMCESVYRNGEEVGETKHWNEDGSANDGVFIRGTVFREKVPTPVTQGASNS